MDKEAQVDKGFDCDLQAAMNPVCLEKQRGPGAADWGPPVTDTNVTDT
jgi:hypothetical protein